VRFNLPLAFENLEKHQILIPFSIRFLPFENSQIQYNTANEILKPTLVSLKMSSIIF